MARVVVRPGHDELAEIEKTPVPRLIKGLRVVRQQLRAASIVGRCLLGLPCDPGIATDPLKASG